MSDANDLDTLILDAMTHHADEYGPATMQGLAAAATDAVRDAGWRRVVVDDAMIERARTVLVLQHPETVRAALTAALETDTP